MDAARVAATLRRMLADPGHWLTDAEREAVGAAVGMVEPRPIYFAIEAVFELTKLADRFDHPDKFVASWHKKAAVVIEALTTALSVPCDRRLDLLVEAAEKANEPEKGGA
jgi:hypothetical protein